MLTVTDLQKIGDLIDNKLDTKLASIKKDIKKIKLNLAETTKYFDHDWHDHEKRIQKLETVTKVSLYN